MIEEIISEEIIDDETLTNKVSVSREYTEADIFESRFILIIESIIENEIYRLNKAKGISIKDKITCKAYADTTGYPYQKECADLWKWSVFDLYGPLRAWKAKLKKIPTEEEFLTELKKHSYTVVYPEEKAV